MKQKMTRRAWMKSSFAALASLAAVKSIPGYAEEMISRPEGMKVAAKSKVYMTKEISPASLVKI